MEIVEVLTVSASKFVRRDFRERFVHEALKKPRKLHSRICHNIDQVFAQTLANGQCSFRPSDPCLILGWGPEIELITWRQATEQFGVGGGLLVIDGSGTKFHAETEAEPGTPSVIYAGGS